MARRPWRCTLGAVVPGRPGLVGPRSILGAVVDGRTHAATREHSGRDSTSALQALSGTPRCMLGTVVFMGHRSSRVERRHFRSRGAAAESQSAGGLSPGAGPAPPSGAWHRPSLRPRLSPRACRRGEVPEPARAATRSAPLVWRGTLAALRPRCSRPGCQAPGCALSARLWLPEVSARVGTASASRRRSGWRTRRRPPGGGWGLTS